MSSPKTTPRKQRLQAMVDMEIYSRVVTLAGHENRSESNMSALLIEEALASRESAAEKKHFQPKAANA